MPGYFAAVDGFRNGRAPLHPLAPITPSAQRTSDRRSLQPAQHLLPAKPDSIPVDAIDGSHLSVQPKLAIGSAASPLETEADRMAAQVLSSRPGSGFGVGPGSQPASAALHRRASAGSGSQTAAQPQAPAIVHDALGSPGQPLDSATRASVPTWAEFDCTRAPTPQPPRDPSTPPPTPSDRISSSLQVSTIRTQAKAAACLHTS